MDPNPCLWKPKTRLEVAKTIHENTSSRYCNSLFQALSKTYWTREIPITDHLSLHYGLIGNSKKAFQEKKNWETLIKPIEELNWLQIVEILLKDPQWQIVCDVLRDFPELKKFFIRLDRNSELYLEKWILSLQSNYNTFKASHFADLRNIMNFTGHTLSKIDWQIQCFIRDKIGYNDYDAINNFLEKKFGFLYLLSIFHELWHEKDQNEFHFENVWNTATRTRDTRRESLTQYLLWRWENEKNAWDFALKKISELQKIIKFRFISREEFVLLTYVFNIYIFSHTINLAVTDKDGKKRPVEKEKIINFFEYLAQEDFQRFLF